MAYLQTYAARMVQAGPLLDLDGRPCGSLLMIDVADRARKPKASPKPTPTTAPASSKRVTIRAYRQVFKDGELLG